MQNINIKVNFGDELIRVDKFICQKVNIYTRSAVQKLIQEGCVIVNNQKLKDKNYKVKEGDIISVFTDDPKEINIEPEDIPIDVVYEDDDLLIVNKEKGMVVHPAPGHYRSTLVNALLYHCQGSLSGINGVIRPGIVHRIDKDTSGLLIVAKNDFSHRILAKQIKDHSFKREYEAIVHGNMKSNTGTVNLPIGRHPKDRKKMAVNFDNCREAITHFEVKESYDKFTRLKLTLETGRTHQIRVHMAYIGHPVIGDEVYGKKNTLPELVGQCLHAKTIGFLHPRSNKYMEFTSTLPEYFTNIINILTWEWKCC